MTTSGTKENGTSLVQNPKDVQISPELQQAFANFLETHYPRSVDLKIDAPNLFFTTESHAKQTGDTYERYYFNQPVQGEFSMSRDVKAYLSFRNEQLSKSQFLIIETRKPADGDQPSEHIGISSWINREDRSSQVSIRARMGSRILEAIYSDGTIAEVAVKDDKTQDSAAFGYQGLQRTNAIQNGMATFNRQEKGDVKDLVRLPEHLDLNDLTRKLFPNQFVPDIKTTDLTFDEVWTNISLQKTFGIDWQRPN